MIDHRLRRALRLPTSGRSFAATAITSAVMVTATASGSPTPMSAAPMSSAPHGLQDDGVAAPLPGADAMDALSALAGRWTLDMPSGAGLVARQTVAWNDDESALLVDWSTVDASGTVLAEGRGRIGWDDIAGAVVNTYAGRDGERRFSGSATLIAIDGAVSDWRGHETRGSGGSVNFEVTYDLRDDALFVVDFIPTCLDGLDTLSPVRFAWSLVDPFLEAMPNADDLAGAWTLASGGNEGIPDGSTMSVTRGAGGRSLVFVIREPGRERGGEVVPGAIVGIEHIWFDAETGGLHDRYLSMDGSVMTGTPRLGVRGEDETPVVMVRWGEDQSGPEAMRITSWMWVDGGELQVAFTDLEVGGEPADAPPAMVWTRP